MNRDPQAWAQLGAALARARQAQGLTQEEVAERAGCSTASVQSAEAGKVPKARMPYTVTQVATALGWPAGSVEAVLDGASPPGGWKDVPVQKLLDAEQVETIFAGAMVRATENATPAEIKKAARLALDELRRQGLV